MLEFDIDTYNRTKDLPGGPVFTVTETDYPEIEMIVDAKSKPSRGELIGHAIAYTLIASLICGIFYVL